MNNKLVDFKNPDWQKRCLMMILGIFFLGMGIGLFKLSLFGNDPSSAMMMAIANKVGLSFPITLIIGNCIFFIVEIIWGRKYIGLGTLINWFFVGTFADLWVSWITAFITIPDDFVIRLIVMLIGVLILSMACSLYQTADLGIAPYDVLSLVLTDKTSIKYFWCRIFTDSVCTIVAFLFGGIIGIGTLTCALGLGPFINFFNKHVSSKLLS